MDGTNILVGKKKKTYKCNDLKMGWIIESDTQIWCFSFFFFGLPNSIHCCLNASLAPAFRKVCWFFILCWKSVRWFHIKTFGQLTTSWPRLQQKWSSQTRGSKVPNFLSLIFRCHICYMSNFPRAILFLSNLVYYYYLFFFSVIGRTQLLLTL